MHGDRSGRSWVRVPAEVAFFCTPRPRSRPASASRTRTEPPGHAERAVDASHTSAEASEKAISKTTVAPHRRTAAPPDFPAPAPDRARSASRTRPRPLASSMSTLLGRCILQMASGSPKSDASHTSAEASEKAISKTTVAPHRRTAARRRRAAFTWAPFSSL